MTKSHICSIPDCGKKPARTRGWCDMHYQRWRKHGDPLKLITASTGEPLRYFHEVVLAYEGNECLPWPYAKTQGYGIMWHEGRNALVSRLVCEHTHGPAPSPKHEAAHSCGKGHEACCTKRHLSWKTSKQNEADKLLHGTDPRGERHGQAKLSEADVSAIRASSDAGVALAARYGVSSATICDIKHGRTWRAAA